MHLGFHGSSLVSGDTIHLNNITYAFYKPTVQIGLARSGMDARPTLGFWHQVAISGYRLFTNLPLNYSLDAAVIHVLVDRDSDGTQEPGPPADPTKDGWWEKVVPFYGAPMEQRFPAGNCTYDPNDDGNNESEISDSSPTFQFNTAGTVFGPSTTCFPEFVFACVGDTQDPPYDPNQGQAPAEGQCFPEVAANGAPVVREGTGPGRWVETRIDLYPYRGRQIWFRFLTTHVQFGFATWSDGFQGPFGGNRDDGWYIDDINITGLNTTAFTLKADTDAPPASSCPNPNTCLPITARVSGSTYPTRTDNVDNDADSTTDESDEGGFTTVLSDAPLRNVLLNGQDLANPTTTTGCLNGVLQYRFSIDGDQDGTTDSGEIFRDWTEDPRATANPAQSSIVAMDVRCSTLQSGVGRATLNVVITDVPYLTFQDVNTLKWTATTGASTYDVATRQDLPGSQAGVDANTWLNPTTGRFNSMTCNIDNQAGTTRSIAAQGSPAAGFFDIWLVRKNAASWEEVGSTPFGTVTRDTVMIDTTPVCP